MENTQIPAIQILTTMLSPDTNSATVIHTEGDTFFKFKTFEEYVNFENTPEEELVNLVISKMQLTNSQVVEKVEKPQKAVKKSTKKQIAEEKPVIETTETTKEPVITEKVVEKQKVEKPVKTPEIQDVELMLNLHKEAGLVISMLLDFDEDGKERTAVIEFKVTDWGIHNVMFADDVASKCKKKIIAFIKQNIMQLQAKARADFAQLQRAMSENSNNNYYANCAIVA